MTFLAGVIHLFCQNRAKELFIFYISTVIYFLHFLHLFSTFFSSKDNINCSAWSSINHGANLALLIFISALCVKATCLASRFLKPLWCTDLSWPMKRASQGLFPKPSSQACSAFLLFCPKSQAPAISCPQHPYSHAVFPDTAFYEHETDGEGGGRPIPLSWAITAPRPAPDHLRLDGAPSPSATTVREVTGRDFKGPSP